MPFKIESIEDAQFVVRLESEPEFIHGFWMAPSEPEQCLKEGDWIVLVFAIWNIHDRPAINTAIDVAKEFKGTVNFGIRPFESVEEFATWCFGCTPPNEFVEIREQPTNSGVQVSITPITGTTPIWIFLRNGFVVHTQNGLQNNGQLRSTIDQYFCK